MLKEIMKNEGQREPILLWEYEGERILIDGHNRYNLCKELGIQPQVRMMEFKDLEAVKDKMIINQLGCRNLKTISGFFPSRITIQSGKEMFGEFSGLTF